MNLERTIARDRTVMRWTSPTLDSIFYDLSRAGDLAGVEELRQGLGIEVSPYTIGRVVNDFGEDGRHWLGAFGGDATYRITPEMAAVGTINTDFAETEVDSRQLNVTRFPLFFPERRAFFLEGSNQYVFGLGLEQQFIPFFSRTVGLYEGQQIPITAGFKLNGRAGRWNTGMLDVQTRDTVLTGTTQTVPGTNLFAGRVSYDATPRLLIGTIVTNGNPDGVHRNSLAGFDAVWRTSEFLGNKNLQFGGWTAFSSGDIPAGDRKGWGFGVDYPNDLWNCSASLNQYGEALDPALGYLPRPGTRRFDRFRLEFQSSPHRPWEFGTTTWFGTFYDGNLLQQNNYFRLTAPSGSWQVGVNINQNLGTLQEGNFVQRLWQLNLAYAFSPNLVLTSFLQYDTESQNIGNNLRLRWTIKPGNDLFVVWNRGWRRIILTPEDLSIVPDSDLFAVKLRWTFRR